MTDWIGNRKKSINKQQRLKGGDEQTTQEIKEAIENRLKARIELLAHTALYSSVPETEEDRKEQYRKQVVMREMVRTLNNKTNAVITVNKLHPDLKVTVDDIKKWESQDPAWTECTMIIEDIDKDMIRAKLRNIAMDGHSYILPLMAKTLLPEFQEKAVINDQRQYTQINFTSMTPGEQLKQFKMLKQFIPKKTELPVK